jgi:hypothetical protein
MDYRILIPHMWREQAEEHWRAAVKVAMMNRPAPPPTYHRELLSLSGTLIHEGRCDIAVIIAQMACEVLTEETLTPLLKGRKPSWNFNVGNPKVRKLYIKLTHDRIDTAPFWTKFGAHVTRRHKVVHRGHRVSPAEALESLSVATEFVDHVEKVQKKLAGTP